MTEQFIAAGGRAQASGASRSRTGRLARREHLDPLLQLVQRAVDQAEAFELAYRVGEILAAMPAPADALQDETRRLLRRQPTGIAGMMAAHGECMRVDNTVRAAHADRSEIVDPADHLALPQIAHRRPGRCGGNAQRHAATGAAAIEAEDEAGAFRRAAIAVGIDAEAAM